MPGADAATRRVTNVNVNWRVGASKHSDGYFELLVLTEDGERHVVAPSAAAATALLTLTQTAPVLLWDPANSTLIGANVVGEWLPQDWSAADRAGFVEQPQEPATPPG